MKSYQEKITTSMNPPLKRGNNRGLFISLEGIEGTGKSTQAGLLSKYLSKRGFKTVLTEEPGGTVISSRIRKILLSTKHDKMDYITELLLYNAARTQHIKEKIIPAIENGKVVITDRFSDSTVAYQGYGRGISLKIINRLDEIATGRMRPDITILIDLDVKTGLERNRAVNKRDRLELQDIKFHNKVRKGYLELAKKDAGRIKMVDGAQSINKVHQRIIDIINKTVLK